MDIKQLNQELGNIDLYLLDQILKDNIAKNSKILDAGCGEGRNLVYFLNNGYDVHGIDKSVKAIHLLQFIIGSKYPHAPKNNFQIANLDDLPYTNENFDFIICNAVLHFAKNEDEFWSMMNELDRVLAPTGQLFIRMTSDIGLTSHQASQEKHVFELEDGSKRFLLNHEMINEIKTKFNFQTTEDIKTVVVDGKRCMSTLIFQKNNSEGL